MITAGVFSFQILFYIREIFATCSCISLAKVQFFVRTFSIIKLDCDFDQLQSLQKTFHSIFLVLAFRLKYPKTWSWQRSTNLKNYF